ncbi:MAG: hypothetical protein OQK78_00885 [Gammaproteobacteria bacterium]|nr:hypothetical protein [Gammaproteobacteria bacterium]
MMQQINLYQPIFRKERKIFSAKTLLIGNLLVLIGLAVLFAFTLWQGESLQSQLTQTIKQRDENNNRINQLSAQYPQKSRDPQLAVKIANAKQRLAFLNEITTTLASQINGIEGGFSEHLAGLSRQDVADLWLNQITILRGGGEIRLRGSTTLSERVPYYIQKLSNEDIFEGTSFHRLSIERPATDKMAAQSDLINFTLETALKPGSENGTIPASAGGRRLGTQKWDVKSPEQILEERMR